MRRIDAVFVAALLAVTPASVDAQTPMRSGAVSEAVERQWPAFDRDRDGRLSPLEFGIWVMAANGQDMANEVAKGRGSRRANLTAVRVLNVTAMAFATADADHDRAVTPAELTKFLMG